MLYPSWTVKVFRGSVKLALQVFFLPPKGWLDAGTHAVGAWHKAEVKAAMGPNLAKRLSEAERLWQGGIMLTMFVATRNRHKAQEIAAILGTAASVRDLAVLPGAPAAVEDAATFEGNAAKKAVALAAWLLGEGREHLPPAGPWFALADDSGLEVDALGGAPGVASARFAAVDDATGQAASLDNTPDADNNAKLLRLLAAVPWEQRTARFRCALALAPLSRESGLGEIRVFTGKCEGRIGFAPRGEHGFGYDPLFFPLGHEQTFAELGEEVKNRISHRAQALAALRDYLQGQGLL